MADGAGTYTVSGFSDPNILVFNISNPLMPEWNEATTVDGSAGNYRVSFNASSAGSRYVALTAGGAGTGLAVSGDSASGLSSKGNKADYVVIAPSDLIDAARPLADYRKGQGLTTMVVSLDDIMDEFNFGISSPEAIRSFLTYAYKNWSKPPKYVVLAGEGTWDYRNIFGLGGNVVPPILVATPMGLFPSDNSLADVNGDHVPEIAIGRLPVLTAADLQAVINKIITFESRAGNRVIMAADNADDGGNFTADSDNLAALVPSTYPVEKIYLSGDPAATDQTRQRLLDSMNRGAVLLNYIGHAGMGQLADEDLLDASYLSGLSNFNGMPIVTAMTCLVGDFATPGYDSLSQSLVLKSDGGAVAVWAAAGLSMNPDARLLAQGFFSSVFKARGKGVKTVLGDAILQAFRAYRNTGGPSYVLDIYTLLGDPALRMW
jgi:hypothetical protein